MFFNFDMGGPVRVFSRGGHAAFLDG